MSHSSRTIIIRSALASAGLLLLAGCGAADSDFALEPEEVSIVESSLTGAPVRAVILVDSRLSSALGTLIGDYRTLAERRRGFSIDLQQISGLDDWSPSSVKDKIKALRAATPTIEGVLIIGNVKLPSFYKVRADNPATRLYPVYFEDLDGAFTKHYADGALDPSCDGTNAPYCVVGDPVTVPRHTFDGIAKGASPDPEIWASFMPVGVAGTANSYTDYANQLRPYLQKVIAYYKGSSATNGRYYLLSNDKGETFDLTWNAFGGSKIDFYGKAGPNGETDEACIQNGQNLCHVRWATETYSSYSAFEAAYLASPWPGDDWNWMSPELYTQQLNSAIYDVAELNKHSTQNDSLLDVAQTRALTKAGLLVTLDGCSVGGFRQPGTSAAHVDVDNLASENVLLAYIYGSSRAVAATGDPFNRGHYSHAPTIYQTLKNAHGYLGQGHLARMKRQYALSGSSQDLAENAAEILVGDPFMDLGWYEDFESNSARWTPSGGSWSIVTDGSKVYKQTSTSATASATAGEVDWKGQSVEAKVKVLSYNGSSRYAGLLARYRDSSNYYRLAFKNTTTPRLELSKVVSGVTTVLGYVSFTPTLGTWYTLRLDVVGTTLTAYVNGQQKLTRSDSSRAAGKVGVAVQYAVAEFDQVSVNIR